MARVFNPCVKTQHGLKTRATIMLIKNLSGIFTGRGFVDGDGRQSTVELGRKFYDMKVDHAVRQIRQWVDSLGKKE